MLSRRKFFIAVGLSTLFLAAMLITMPLIGSTHVEFRRVLAGLSPDHEIFFEARLSRVLLAALAGGSLALAGVIFQALLRDSLATPFTLGVSSGAALGAVLAICLGWRSLAGVPAIWAAALVGAALAMALVLSIASEGRRFSSFTLLLSGVTINSMCMALILFLHYFASLGQSLAIVRWLMGGIDAVAYPALGAILAALAPALILSLFLATDLNLLAVGEEWAASRGVSTQRTTLACYLLGSYLAGSVTALTGPIAFVGLIVPHALRLAFGADHRLLLPCSFLVGAGFLAACDTVARTILAPTEIPVGVITALLGGPFFIWLLKTRRSSLWL
jgi:ABC-type Fe3+-siderophore transport system permease subunit